VEIWRVIFLEKVVLMKFSALFFRVLLAATGVLSLGVAADGATQVFLSASETAPRPTEISWQNMAVGGTAGLFIWVIPDVGEVVDGISLSLESTTSGVIEANLDAFPMTASIFNPTFLDGQVRWDLFTVQDPQTLIPPPPPGTPGGVLNEGNLLFRDWNAGAVIPDPPPPGFTPNHGLDAANAADDALWNAATGAFLLSRLEIKALAAGTTDLFLKVGNEGITAGEEIFDLVQFGPGGGLTDGGIAGATDPERDGLINVVRLPGDTNGDERVDIDDLNNVRNNFGSFGLGDTNGDGEVDIDDLNAVRNNFGSFFAANAIAVPEPHTAQLLTTIVALFVFFGWRGASRLLESGK